jgi:hypothetical protein
MRIHSRFKYAALAAILFLTAIVYWPGLCGGFLFDDYPNIVDNPGVQPHDASLASLVGAALSSPSSEFSRPLASLSFAANYLATGLDPYWMKLTNLVLHLLNGWLIFILSLSLFATAEEVTRSKSAENAASSIHREDISGTSQKHGIAAVLLAFGWLILPINLTGVLYVVQRMESLANLFVLLGLIGYIAGRRKMLDLAYKESNDGLPISKRHRHLEHGFLLCIASLILCTILGGLAKETALMLPLYAAIVEWLVFRLQRASHTPEAHASKDSRLTVLFALVLALPFVVGLLWLLPRVLSPYAWETRNFTLSTRLLSEARVVVDYIFWTFFPQPHDLSFYHDDFTVSQGLLTPWTTATSIVFLMGLVILLVHLRRRYPLISLGVALYLGCHLLTGTIYPLELVYEHRNYFASFGLLLVLISTLVVSPPAWAIRFTLAGRILLLGLLIFWTATTVFTAYAWGTPLRLAEELAARAPGSPRAQYELGRIYIMLSRYDPASPFTKLAYAPLERAAAIPGSSILPEQALIFMNSRMQLPLEDAWWNSMITKLRDHAVTVQDESSLAALTKCASDHSCILPKDRMMDAFQAAISHPQPNARLFANYGDYAWNVLANRQLGLQMFENAVSRAPEEPAYRVNLARAFLSLDMYGQAEAQIAALQRLNYGGRLNDDLASLRDLLHRKLH